MFEHVGIAHYRSFFARVGELLAKDGAALTGAASLLLRSDSSPLFTG
jgi:cyclopropane fatty-acyl-phospholipid synthase-like methyltransferase